MSFKDSLTIKFNKNLKFLTSGSLKLSEQGNLHWTDFTSKPSRYIEEIFVEPKLTFEISKFEFGAGIRYFTRNSFAYVTATEKKMTGKYKSFGPVSDVYYSPSGKLSIRFSGWYEFIYTESDTERNVSNFNFDVIWRI